MTDEVIHSTKYYIKYINSAIFVNLQQKPLKLGRLIVLNATHPQPLQFLLPWQPNLFQSLQPDKKNGEEMKNCFLDDLVT